jgi:hypothetical protein
MARQRQRWRKLIRLPPLYCWRARSPTRLATHKGAENMSWPRGYRGSRTNYRGGLRLLELADGPEHLPHGRQRRRKIHLWWVLMAVRRVVQAIVILVSAILLTAAVSWAADLTILVRAYETRFNFRPGSWFGERIARSEPTSQTCIIIGSSTARQGLDPEILAKLVPGTRFLNAGTTGGTMDVLEIQSQIIARYGRKYRCIIAAIHPWMLRTLGRPEIVSSEYIAHLRLTDLLSLTGRWWVWDEAGKLSLAFLLPLKKHAPQFNRLVRRTIYELQVMIGPGHSIARYESFDQELRPSNDFVYEDNPKQLVTLGREAVRKYLVDLGWFDRSHYASPEPTVSFERFLRVLQPYADHIILISMPSSVLWDEINALVRSRYKSVVERLPNNVSVVNCENGLTDPEFVDHAHANDDGRKVLSVAIGSILGKLLASGSIVDLASARRVCEVES